MTTLSENKQPQSTRTQPAQLLEIKCVYEIKDRRNAKRKIGRVRTFERMQPQTITKKKERITRNNGSSCTLKMRQKREKNLQYFIVCDRCYCSFSLSFRPFRLCLLALMSCNSKMHTRAPPLWAQYTYYYNNKDETEKRRAHRRWQGERNEKNISRWKFDISFG